MNNGIIRLFIVAFFTMNLGHAATKQNPTKIGQDDASFVMSSDSSKIIAIYNRRVNTQEDSFEKILEKSKIEEFQEDENEKKCLRKCQSALFWPSVVLGGLGALLPTVGNVLLRMKIINDLHLEYVNYSATGLGAITGFLGYLQSKTKARVGEISEEELIPFSKNVS